MPDFISLHSVSWFKDPGMGSHSKVNANVLEKYTFRMLKYPQFIARCLEVLL